MAVIKHHFGVELFFGLKAICGRTKTKHKVKDRAKWDALNEDVRCSDCDAAVKRDGAPRPDRIYGKRHEDDGAATSARTHTPKPC